MGSALADALRAAGADVHGPFGRGESSPGAAIVLLCVPDREIAAASAVVEPEAIGVQMVFAHRGACGADQDSIKRAGPIERFEHAIDERLKGFIFNAATGQGAGGKAEPPRHQIETDLRKNRLPHGARLP